MNRLWIFIYFLSFTYAIGQEPVFPELKPDSAWYTVSGERHGISYFKQHRFEGVEYEIGDILTFDRYHTVNVMVGWLHRWADAHPDLVELAEIAKSYEGRPIYQLTLTNKKTGKSIDKPAAYFEGGRHSGEVTASESAFWLADYLLKQYGSDKSVTRLLDTKSVIIRPQNNPDGSNLYLHTAQSNRSTLRPHDSDRDGLLDEDPPEDLDGDGVIYRIRWKVKSGEEDKGNTILDPRDPTGRLMKSVPEGFGDWRVISEGIDNDGDEKYNEDGIGGLDLHRNYPENWRPDRGKDATKRGYTQFGAGDFPMSETETRSVVIFLLQNPNVSIVNSMDTRVPMHLRPPSTSFSAERMFEEDRLYYEQFDEIGKNLTGYPWAGDVYDVYRTRYPVNQRTGDPSRPGPLFGHGPDFGYFYYGAIWYGDELWNGGRMKDYNGDDILDDVDGLAWDDEHNNGQGFREWESFTHPDLGEVEIGGFHPKFFSQNGPAEELESWAKNQALFNLEMAKHLPQIEWKETKIRKHSWTKNDSVDFEISLSWTNSGRLPTALKQAQLVKIVQEDRAVLDIKKDLTKGRSPKVKIILPNITDKTIHAGYTEPGEIKEVLFKVRLYDVNEVLLKAKILSTRGGLLEKELTLKK